MLVTKGEHESTRWGFRVLLEMKCADIIQPDVGWCGGITELIKISALADAHGVMVVPHGSRVYSYQFVLTRHHSPFAEFLMLAPGADEAIQMFRFQKTLRSSPLTGKGTSSQFRPIPHFLRAKVALKTQNTDQVLDLVSDSFLNHIDRLGDENLRRRR